MPTPISTFKEELKSYFAIEHCFLLSLGKESLAIILKAIREMYPERDEVFISAFACFLVSVAIHKAGLSCNLCDIDPQTLDFDKTILKK